MTGIAVACGAPAPLPIGAETTADTADAALGDTTAPPADTGETVAGPDAAETAQVVDAVADLTVPVEVSATADVTADATPADVVADAGLACSADCPEAILTPSGNVAPLIPQAVFKPSCAKSVPTCGAKVAKCLWTIKTPNGDNQVESLPDAPPAIAANQAGEYKLCLEVVDTAGKKSCKETCLTFLVIPNNALHIELTWQTPTDPDPWDSGPAAGSDLDLHFAHPMASALDGDCDGTADPWFSNPWDVFWFNASPAWGAANDPKDDPTLDLDDTDGAGPENLNLVAPEGTLAEPHQYSIGVHYWNDHGYGSSTATVAVYLQGGLAFKLVQKLNPCEMWYVGKLNWPNTASGGVLPIFKPCYQTGLSCPAGKNLMWAPAGDACVTPVYAKPKGIPGVGGC